MKRLLCFILLLAAALSDCSPSSTAYGQAPDPAVLTASSALESARLTLSAFTSIQYEFRSESVGPGKQSNQSKRVEIGRFEYDNGKFRSEYTIDSDDYKTSGISTFDGKAYQLKRDDIPRVSVLADYRVPYHITQPIMYPFTGFLGDPTIKHRFDLESFRGPDYWNSAIERATLVGRRQVDGHPCAVVKIEPKPPSRAVAREVYLALDLDCYPIQVTYENKAPADRIGTMRVVELADIKTSQGRAIVPIRIETKSHDSTNSIQSTTVVTVDRETLRVNEPIDAKRFDLSQ